MPFEVLNDEEKRSDHSYGLPIRKYTDPRHVEQKHGSVAKEVMALLSSNLDTIKYNLGNVVPSARILSEYE
jgi:hypothetical protein